MKTLFAKRRRLFIIVFLSILTIVSIVLAPLVVVNYDMSAYLPEDSNTKVSIEVMQDEFGNVSMVQMMTVDLDLLDAAHMVDEMKAIEVVRSVLWLGAIADMTTPVESMDQSLIRDFYQDGKMLFTIEFSDDDYSLVVGDAIDEIKEIATQYETEYYLRGSALGNKNTRDLVNGEMLMIFLIALPAAIAILFLVSTSWFEPVIILINLGVAIVINLGTNVFLPSVSYITMSIASILQLAMSLDYSLFIVHRYYEIRDTGEEPVPAATLATKDAFRSVTASSLTTIFGFLSLIIMRYKIGLDVGLSLTKAIAISYVVTLIFIPVLLIVFDKKLLKYKHKILLPNFAKITSRLNKGRVFITALIFIIGGLAFYLQSKTTYFYSDTQNKDETSVIYQHDAAITDVFGPFEPIIILYQHEDVADALLLADQLNAIPEVISIQSLVTSVDPAIPEEMIPIDALTQFKGDRYYRMIVLTNLTEESERSYALSAEMIHLTQETLTHGGYVIGAPIAVTEIKEAVTVDGILVQLVSAIAVGLVIGLILKNPITPLILVILIEISIWINISITYLSGGAIAYIGYLVVSSLQLGATIDYAVLVSSRYQELRDPTDPKRSMVETMEKSAPAIITSAAVLVVAGIAVVLVSSLDIVKEIGLLIGRGALLSGVLTLFVLPALLLTFDKVIEKYYKKRKMKP